LEFITRLSDRAVAALVHSDEVVFPSVFLVAQSEVESA
jgi:hypothetical protein